MLPRRKNRNIRQSGTKVGAFSREGPFRHKPRWVSTKSFLGAIALVGAVSAAQANAQVVTPEQVEDLQKQISVLEKKLESVQHNTFLNASAGYMPTKGTFAPPDVLVSMKGGAPRFCTADGFNCVGLTGRLHFDVGGYNYTPNSSATVPQDLQDGVNARRARIGITGIFARDWVYALIGEFGGSQDGTGTINNAFLSYKGFENTSIDIGYMKVMWSLEQATSSNNITFMERSSAQVMAADLGAGGQRAAVGVIKYDKWWWAGAYLTGPERAYDHTLRVPYSAVGRLVFTPINTDVATFLFGGEVLYLADTGGAPGVNDIRLRERIELRIDPTRVLDTHNIANVDDVRVLSAEVGGAIGPFHAQSEYFDYSVSRFGNTDLHFKGGYVQAGYILTGEKRKYLQHDAAFGGVRPSNPFVWDVAGGIGAWEIAARYSYMDLNDNLVFGGKQNNVTVGLNWYLNDNMRVMFNWIHGTIAKSNLPGQDLGAKWDAYAMRTQWAF
ncbi:phosphate-selective porin OprO/OprP [Nitrobacter vulgaris]|uniref:OprO/OprP family phosphate-selective porin n=1 Tax=Nitrobacter vulgaris TaxID=29421 RepID=UPI00285C2694|nr:porin [Nitrobacter vulgaris]MDR6302670.1 phosphate-selective porin OprO/OprP [Nitrobacter vulgaris]